MNHNPDAPDWSAHMLPPLPVLLRAAADRVPDTATPPGIAACLVRILREHADAIEQHDRGLDPETFHSHLVATAIQTLNDALGRGWKTADLDDGPDAQPAPASPDGSHSTRTQGQY